MILALLNAKDISLILFLFICLGLGRPLLLEWITRSASVLFASGAKIGQLVVSCLYAPGAIFLQMETQIVLHL